MACIPPHLLREAEWISVSASVCRFATSWTTTCFPRPLDASGYEIGTGRGVISLFDLHAPWYFVAGNVYPYLILGMGFILTVVFGLCGYIKQTYLTMSLVFVLPGMLELICGFCFLVDKKNHDGTGDSVFFLMHGFGLCWMGLMMLFAVPLAFWWGAVLVYSVLWCRACAYPQTWSIAALPAPLDQWAGLIVLSIFGVLGIDRLKR